MSVATFTRRWELCERVAQHTFAALCPHIPCTPAPPAAREHVLAGLLEAGAEQGSVQDAAEGLYLCSVRASGDALP